MNLTPPTPEGLRLAPLIDHTLLKPVATRGDVRRLCAEAVHYGFAAVCVNPCMTELVASELKGSAVKPCTVIGFPLGATTTAVKAFEAQDAIHKGAKELDMVISLSPLKAGDTDSVAEDIRAVVRASGGLTVKVIIETFLLSDEEKVTACRLAVKAGAHFVKTSSGFSGGGATVEDIRLMRKAVGPDVGVKASGGIRTLQDALRMIEAGANRIGTSAGVAIVTSGPGPG